jgi:hypothetical protein
MMCEDLVEPQQGSEEVPTKEDIHQDTEPNFPSPILSLLPLGFIEMAAASTDILHIGKLQKRMLFKIKVYYSYCLHNTFTYCLFLDDASLPRHG